MYNRYNPAMDAWTACEPMGNARWGFAAAAINGSIIVVGGFGNDNEPLASVERYDAVANTWTACAPMSRARGDVAGCAVGTSL